MFKIAHYFSTNLGELRIFLTRVSLMLFYHKKKQQN